ncbi:36417_t:CDS:2 [Gigaspora margarita]|uniref:36417_t:CDS:1 n=1 Tax=Gigaspora margarita TaxID=4874 RepID=A0ABN7UPY2_GIGMA|nr:36417_t:CDS:2 [Gigaspora margarita]
MDRFDMTGNFTIDHKGEKTIHTVELAMKKIGLQLFYMCYRKELPHGKNIPPGVIAYEHLEDSVKDGFWNSGTDLVIPGDLTSICQPLDVVVNKPFKDNLHKEWHLWMSKGGAGITKAGNLQCKDIEVVNISEDEYADEDIEVIDISEDIEIMNINIETMNVSENESIGFIDISEEIGIIDISEDNEIINSEDNNIVNLSEDIKIMIR